MREVGKYSSLWRRFSFFYCFFILSPRKSIIFFRYTFFACCTRSCDFSIYARLFDWFWECSFKSSETKNQNTNSAKAKAGTAIFKVENENNSDICFCIDAKKSFLRMDISAFLLSFWRGSCGVFIKSKS